MECCFLDMNFHLMTCSCGCCTRIAQAQASQNPSIGGLNDLTSLVAVVGKAILFKDVATSRFPMLS